MSGIVTLKPVVSSFNTLQSDIISTLVTTKLRNELDGLYTLWKILNERNCRRRRTNSGAGQRRELLSGFAEAFQFASDDRIGVKILK